MPVEYEAHMRRLVKKELRTRMKSVRRAMPAEARKLRSDAIAHKILALPEWKNARTVSLYIAMRDEIDVTLLIDDAVASKKTIALPRVDDQTDLLELHAWAPGIPLHASAFGVEEPAASLPIVPDLDVDLVIVPALAIDETGHRIGYGAGYYDRLLPRLTQAVRVGVAFDFQLIAEVPAEPTDVPVHAVVTDARVVSVGTLRKE